MDAARSSAAREWLVIAVLTVAGAILRFWNFGWLSLSHFDEGIYAFSGLWVLSPHGLRDLDPGVIAYAPPGFPILVGLAYGLFGVSDYAAIVVAILAGVATIPVVGWLGRRTFGPGAGAAAATFAALAMAHVAFSRKALTDAPFLLVWLAALGLGARYLERPGFLRALGLGVAVGVAQNVKYNGWLSIAIVVLAAVARAFSDREERASGALLRTFGWGLAVVLVGGFVYAPWYQFVETHGGYAALLRHHSGYMNVAGWRRNWTMQLAEASALSGERSWGALTGLLACFLFCVTLDRTSLGGLWSRRRWLGSFATVVIGAYLFSLQAYFPWWLGLGWTPWLLWAKEPSLRLLGSWWLVLTAVTPLYHPYARLWLPIHAAGWLFMAGLIAQAASFYGWAEEAEVAGRGEPSRRPHRLVLLGAALACGASAAIHIMWAPPSAVSWSAVLVPSPATLRTFAFKTVPETIPGGGTPVCVFARRPLAFYLAQLGRYTIQLEANEDRILTTALPDCWKILDRALLNDTAGNLPVPWALLRDRTRVDVDPVTMLDIDPGAALRPPVNWPFSQQNQRELYVIAPDRPAARIPLRTPTTPGRGAP